ncbi:AAEL009906-PB [Aedes aegypti]|uniref:AAEL009906-PB n=1 Tax=Aedes aegypti TaxID=7159 RepID=Q16UH4_AEDAE|nr:AAEL009906-PB [Aedes aegypti]
MALEEPKLADVSESFENGADQERPPKRDDAPDYYKRPKFKRNIIPFETDDLSVRVIRERFLIPNQVKEQSPAAKAGLKLGDQIVTINGADASAMRLATAESVIKQAGEQLQLVVAKDDEEAAKNPNKPKETREIKFAGEEDDRAEINNPSAPKHKSNEGRDWIQPPERKVWHPIVWQQPPPPIPPDVYGKDAPHQQLIRNIRRLLTETAKKPEERQKHIEHMMLSLPTGPKPKEDDPWADDPVEPEPAPKPKKKKKSKGKKKVVVRKRTESETSEEDSVAHEMNSTPAAAADPIPEED